MSNQPVNPAETEVDFVNLTKTIWKRKLLVVKLTGIAAVAGFLISIMIPNRYTASTTLFQGITDLRTRLNDEKQTAVSALAAVSGVDLNGLTGARMSSQALSTILSSVPFRQELMKTSLNFGQLETATTLFDYYTKQKQEHRLVSYIFSIPSRILSILKTERKDQNSNPNPQSLPQLTREELVVNKIIDRQVTLQLHDEAYVTIFCSAPEAYAAAQLTWSTCALLERYLTEIQTEKARASLRFIQEKHDEARMNFQKIQEEISTIHEGKEDVRLSVSCRLAENVYLELSRQLELAKIALNEQTPVFKIVNPVTVPTSHSYPNRTKIIAFFSFFGFILAMGLILGKGFIEDTKEKWGK